MPERCKQVLGLLPDRLKQSIPVLTREELACVEEVRLRAGQKVMLTMQGTVRPLTGSEVEQQELDQLLQKASNWSIHTVLHQLREGYMTVEGGHRLGVAGTAVMEHGQVRTIRDISSINMRVARQIKGCASDVALQIRTGNRVKNTLILAPPGAGKTTLLRDMIRIFSQQGVRVAVADERGELAAAWQGRAQMDLGGCTDVLTGCPKAQAVHMLLRGMNPQVVAVDEITAPEDVRAMEQAMGCGVAVLATAHAEDLEDMRRRAVYRGLLTAGVFERFVILTRVGGKRAICVKDVREIC